MAASQHAVSLVSVRDVILGASRCCVPYLDLLLMHHILGGPKAAFGSAVACGILLGVFEGVGVLLGRVFSEGTRPQLPPREFSFQLAGPFLKSASLLVPESMAPQASSSAAL